MDFKVERNDISKMRVDVVVLPANAKLVAGTGASMALYEAAGRKELEAECALRRKEAKDKGVKLVPGVSVFTLAYALPARAILHTIVPKWNDVLRRKSYEDLCKAYASALVQADEAGFRSIAFPVLASGNNGFDADLALDIAIESLKEFEPSNSLRRAYLVTFDSDITNKMRERGYDVREAIDQVHVLQQGVNQAGVAADDGNASGRRRQKLSHIHELVDEKIRWLQEPEKQKMALALALAVANKVLPDDGKPGKAKKVLNAVAPVVIGKELTGGGGLKK